MHLLKDVSDKELLEQTVILRGKENSIIAKLILALGEIDSRRLYRDAGCSSLFTFLIEKLEHSKSGAHRRVEVARFVRDRPELLSELSEGLRSFSSLYELSRCARSSSEDEVSRIVAETKGKTLQEVSERVAVQVAPAAPVRRVERVRVIKPNETPVEEASLFSANPTDSGRSSNSKPTCYEVSFQADPSSRGRANSPDCGDLQRRCYQASDLPILGVATAAPVGAASR